MGATTLYVRTLQPECRLLRLNPIPIIALQAPPGLVLTYCDGWDYGQAGAVPVHVCAPEASFPDAVALQHPQESLAGPRVSKSSQLHFAALRLIYFPILWPFSFPRASLYDSQYCLKLRSWSWFV